jgi:hypothetical protein
VATSSEQQEAGVTQVSDAMNRVDEVTQRNASSAEELASTAEEMAAQAESLQQLLGLFHVNGDGSGPASHRVDSDDVRVAFEALQAKVELDESPGSSAPGHKADDWSEAGGNGAGATEPVRATGRGRDGFERF